MLNYYDPDFGTVKITVNPRARNITMRPKVDGLRVTVPDGVVTRKDVENAIDKFRLRLIEKRRRLREMGTASDDEIEELRSRAKLMLPRRVAELAYLYGFTYSGLKIQSSRTRWGSCSGRNSINLSLFLMRVPDRLVDYVILHELCHTVHHDHSPAFWELMDKVTDGRAKALRKELGNYTTA